MKHDQIQFKLRLSADLKSKLDEFAAKNDRTLTAEIVERLEASFEKNAVVPVDLLQLELVLARLWNRRNALQLQQVHVMDQRAEIKRAREEAIKSGNHSAAKRLESEMEQLLNSVAHYDRQLAKLDKELAKAEADLAKATTEELDREPTKRP